MHAAVGSRSGVVGAWARRRPWLGVLVLAMIVAAVLVAALGPWRHGAAAGGTNRRAGVAALAGGSVTGGAAQFQIVPGDRPSVVVTGIGEASAPAETATLQIVVRTAESVFGPSEKPRLVPEAESPPPWNLPRFRC